MTAAALPAARAEIGGPAGSAPPFVRVGAVQQIAGLLASGDSVLLTGHHGAGKSSHTSAALDLGVHGRDAVLIGPTSELTVRALLAALAPAQPAQPAIIAIDKPHRLHAGALAAIREAVLHGGARMLLETTSRDALPAELRELLTQTRHSTVHIPPLTNDEFHERLAALLGGPVPREDSRYLWAASGGNPELARLLVTALLDRGDLARGDYAWSLAGSLDEPLSPIPSALTQHVERQLAALSPEQQLYLRRLALCGSIGPENPFLTIDDDALEQLRVGGFVHTVVRRAGSRATQLCSAVFGWVLEGRALPGIRSEVFASLAVPVRGREDPVAGLAWLRLAMKVGAPLAPAQIVLGIESALALHAWSVIETVVDLVIPENRMEHELVDFIVDARAEDRVDLALLLLQRGLSFYFRDLPERARADARTVRAVIERVPQGLGRVPVHLFQLETLSYQTDADDGTLAALSAQTAAHARAHGDEFSAESIEMRQLSTRHEELSRRAPLAELEQVLHEHLGRSPHAVALAPHVALRMAYAGRFDEATALITRTLQLNELRITNLAENVHAFAFSELVLMRAYALILRGKPDAALAMPNEHLARTILDSAAYDTLVAAAQIARGHWGSALHTLRGVLQRLAARDHARFKKLPLSMYVQSCAALGDVVSLRAAIRNYDEAPFGMTSIFEGELEYRVLTGRVAVHHPDALPRLDAYLDRCAAAGEWFHVLRAAHLGAVVGPAEQRAGYLLVLERAAGHVDADVATVFREDAAALCAGDSARLSGTRAELALLGVWLPQRLTAVALTRRQREIAGLVVSGIPNRDIAERLHLSVRTVESHVATILEKAEVGDRRLLAARLGDLG